MRDRGVVFPVMSKIDCSRSSSGHLIYRFLTDSLESPGLASLILGKGIKWNFTKFLCDRNGIPIKRFEPNVNPIEIEPDIVALLSAE